ncbi:MMPL family transporter, partial [bacterium]|nr:MMPL family transporter [bacterium]
MNNNLDSQQKDLSLVRFSVDHPKAIVAISIILMVLFAAMIPWVHVDTDPENMLEKDEPVRVFHNDMKREFSLYDMVVVGIVDQKNPNGVFNPQSLKNAYDLTQFAKTLQWPDPEDPDKQIGVVEIDVMAPSEIDNIEQAGLGSVRFEWLMASPPQTQAEADRIRGNALDNPLLKNTMVSNDGKALCLYLPLTSKDLSYRVYSALNEKIKEFSGTEEYFITGLPVAEDTFGVEMFIQMAISAPLAMLVIFLLMWYFFRKLTLIISPMIVAILSVIYTMGLLIGTGNTVHIMSSMIPIFLMPIAVVDSVHIMSEFADTWRPGQDKKTVIATVVGHLFTPMLFTSLTSAVGFLSLLLTPIPPVQIFGVFVAFGILLAFLLTVILVPAYIVSMKPAALARLAGGRSTPHT